MAITHITTIATSATGYASSRTLALDTSGNSDVSVKVLAFVAFEGSGGLGEDACTGVTYNGVSLTAGTEFLWQNGGGVKHRCKLFYGIFASGVSANVVGTWATGNSQPIMIVSAHAGVASHSGEARTADGTSTTASQAVTTTAGDTAVALAVYDALTPPSGTPSGSTVELYDDRVATTLATGYAYELEASGGTTTPTWTIGTGGGKWSVAGIAMTPAATDTTAPTLTSPTFSATSATTGTATVSTDEANGSIYCVITTSATSPSVAQVQAGQNHSGAAAAWSSGAVAVATTGTKTFSPTGLTASTTYYAHFQHEDAAANDSTVSSSAGDATDAAPSLTSAVLKNNTGTVLASTTIDKVVALKLSDLSTITWSSQTTNGSGQLALTSGSITAATDYLLVTSNTAGTAVGVSKVTSV